MTHSASRSWRRAAFATVIGVTVPAALALSAQSGTAAAPDKTVTAVSTQIARIPERGIADPGPAALTIPDPHGIVTDVDVTLTGLLHKCPQDLNVIVVGPSGRQATLMLDAGDCADEPIDLDLTFDDEADAEIPYDAVPVSGQRYLPTNYYGGEQPPASLEVFDGLAASGTWQLIVVDTVMEDGGTLAGWSIEIDYTDTVAPAGTIAVGDGSALTSAQATSLTLRAIDPSPGTGVTQMRFSTDGSTWSAFRPYAATASWGLSAGDGTKTVYAQFADGIGNLSVPVNDTIVLDTTAPAGTKLTPRQNAADVSVLTRVSFVASESLDPATVTRRTVKLTAHGTTVHAKVSYVPGKRKVIVRPQKALMPETTYKVKISEKVADPAGNMFATKPWTFRTG